MDEKKIQASHWPVIGNKNIVHFLIRVIQEKNPHASYLFTGPEQVGKLFTARYFAGALLCENSVQDGQPCFPCQICRSCQQQEKGIHPDLKRVDLLEGKTEISIEQIRGLIRTFQTSNFSSPYQIAIINRAETLSLGAANACLKLLEEPKGKKVFILVANDYEKVLPTIASRCQVLNFLPVGDNELFFALLERGLERSQAHLVSRFSYGRPGRALDFFKEREKFYEEQEQCREFLKQWLQHRQKKVAPLETGRSEELNFEKVSKMLNSFLHDLILMKTNHHERMSHPSLAENLKLLSEKISWQSLLRLARASSSLYSRFMQSTQEKLFYDLLFFEIFYP